MQFTAAQIANYINATIQGNAQVSIRGFNNIEEAVDGDISFFSNPKYEDFLYASKASAIVISKDFPLRKKVSATLLLVEDAYAAFATLLKIYQDLQVQNLQGTETQAFVSPTATVAKDAYIGAFTYISDKAAIGKNTKIYPGCFIGRNVQVGENSILYPGVKIYSDCKVGNNVIIHAGAVIGADGFGFTPHPDGSYQKIPQIGNVVIGDNVEIGANTTIDRSTLNSTIIGKGIKIDNLVQIAHNVILGENTAIAAQVGISGSTKVGKNVMIAGQAGIAGHIEIADQTIITAQSGVGKTVKTKRILSGSPAFEHMANRRSEAIYRHLPDLDKRLAALEKLVKEMSKG